MGYPIIFPRLRLKRKKEQRDSKAISNKILKSESDPITLIFFNNYIFIILRVLNCISYLSLRKYHANILRRKKQKRLKLARIASTTFIR